MVKISCENYGFECTFEVNGVESEVIKKYQKHSIEEHGIEYSVWGFDSTAIKNEKRSKVAFKQIF